MKNNKFWTILTAAVIVALLAVASFCFVVEEGEQAVVYTFGGIRPGGVKKAPGAYFRWPLGIERVEKVDTRLRTLEIRGNEIVTTRDQIQLYLTVAVAWRVANAETFIRRMANEQGLNNDTQAENLLTARVRDVRQGVVSAFALTDFVSTDKAQADNFRKLDGALLERLREKMPAEDYGVEIASVMITRMAMPKDTIKAINERMIKEREIRSETNVTAGKEEAKKIISSANLEKQNLLSNAAAEARKIKGEGDAKAAEFYQEFKKNPKLALFLRRLDALEEVLKNKATVALPVNAPLDALFETAEPAKEK